MFINQCNKIKKEVEDTIFSFFGLSPSDAIDAEKQLRSIYLIKHLVDFEELTFKKAKPEFRDDLCKYKTLRYFNSIYQKLVELENILKSGEEYDRVKIQ